MTEDQNQYENFKKGIKNDIKYTTISLGAMGGLFLLAVVLLGVLIDVIKATDLGSPNQRFLIGTVDVIVCVLLIFSGKARQWIIGSWLVLLVGIPILFMFFLVFYMLYVMLFKNPL